MENELHQDLQKLFYYDEFKNSIVRFTNKKETETYFDEFMYIFEKQYGIFNKNDFDIIDEEEFGEGSGEICVCTHPIYYLYYMKHIPSGIIWQVGSKCVKNFDENLGKEIENLNARKKKERKGIICKYCEQPLMDLRKKFQKIRYCNENCYSKDTYVIEFGKNKGNILKDFILSDEGYKWFTWVKAVIEKNQNAFIHFPTFSEIINETEII